MTNITLSNLRNSGTELFLDSESYLNELTDVEINMTKGGILSLSPLCIITISIIKLTIQ